MRCIFGINSKAEHIDELTEHLQENYSRDEVILNDIRNENPEDLNKLFEMKS